MLQRLHLKVDDSGVLSGPRDLEDEGAAILFSQAVVLIAFSLQGVEPSRHAEEARGLLLQARLGKTRRFEAQELSREFDGPCGGWLALDDASPESGF
jgi:hypothetical protein